MRVASLILLLVILALIGFAGYCVVFWPDWFDDYARMARGYTPAKTPQELVDRFKEAIKNRDYKTAAEYCTTDMREQLRKAAPMAAALGNATSNLEHNMDQEGIKSDEVKAVLRLLEPFPADVTLENLKHSQGESRAWVVIRDNFTTTAQVGMVGNTIGVKNEQWNVDGEMFRTLARHLFGPMRVATWEMIREGDGDNAKWKFNLAVSDPLRKSVDTLKSHGSNYVRSLDKVKYAIKKDAATKSDLLRELRTELEEAK
jgi:hypothetical protein